MAISVSVTAKKPPPKPRTATAKLNKQTGKWTETSRGKGFTATLNPLTGEYGVARRGKGTYYTQGGTGQEEEVAHHTGTGTYYTQDDKDQKETDSTQKLKKMAAEHPAGLPDRTPADPAGWKKELISWGRGKGLDIDWGSMARIITLSAAVGIGAVTGGTALAGKTAYIKGSTEMAKYGHALSASKGLSAPAIARIAAGQTTKKLIKAETQRAFARQIAQNTVTAAKHNSLLGKACGFVGKNAMLVFGVLGSYLFATQLGFNERGDAMGTYGIIARDAQKAGEYDLLDEIQVLAEDVSTVHKETEAYLPYTNYANAALRKNTAAIMAIKVQQKIAGGKQSGEIDKYGNKKPEEEEKGESKWVQEADGSYTANLKNPKWKKIGGKNVWTE